MSKLEELIKELCPEGVERKTLEELGKFYGGLTGKSKDDFTDGNAKFITYKNVYSNPALDLHPKETVKIAKGEKQRTLQYGDIIFTGSSETPDECGFASVVTEEPDEDLYLNSFCFFLRMDDTSILNPDFAKHLFRCRDLRVQIGKTASGVTRFNVSKKLMEKVTIPIPPLPVQEEIVRILDNFTDLTVELQAELQARAKQYEYYRNELFTNIDGDVTETKMGDVLTFLNGRAYKQEELLMEGKYPVLRVGNFYTNDNWYYSDLELEDNKYCDKGDLLYSWAATLGPKIWDGEKCIFHYHIWKILFDESILDKKYLYYYLQYDLAEIAKSTTKSTMIHISMGSMKERIIKFPSLNKQKEIANLIEKFDLLSTDIKNGLPAEIESRQKQYEYYRNKLLTFKELRV